MDFTDKYLAGGALTAFLIFFYMAWSADHGRGWQNAALPMLGAALFFVVDIGNGLGFSAKAQLSSWAAISFASIYLLWWNDKRKKIDGTYQCLVCGSNLFSTAQQVKWPWREILDKSKLLFLDEIRTGAVLNASGKIR